MIRRWGRRRTLGFALVVLALLASTAPGANAAPGAPRDGRNPPIISGLLSNGEDPGIELGVLVPGTLDVLDPPWYAPYQWLSPPRAGARHPRLLFGTEDLDWIRERALAEGTVPGDAFAAMRRRIDELRVPPTQVGRQDAADAALAWLVTGDDTYVTKARAILRAQVADIPEFGAPTIFEYDLTEYYNKRAHILAGMAFAHDLLHDQLPDAEHDALVRALLILGTEQFLHATGAAWWGSISTSTNFTGNNGAALGLAGLSLWGEVPLVPNLWVNRAGQLVRSYSHAGFDATGAGYEGVLYGNYGLRVATYFNAALQRAGGPTVFRGHVKRQQEWTAYEMLPGGGAVNPLNDARYEELNPTHTAWNASFGPFPELSRWIFDAFRNGHPERLGEPFATILWYQPSDPAFSPAQVLPAARVHRARGLVHVRSGWERHDLMASFEARQADWGESIHQNQDVNSFTLYAEGARLVVDSGYANWLQATLLGPASDRPSSHTQAHNYVVADGRTQDFFGKGQLRRFASTAVLGDPGTVDVALGDAHLAYLVDQPHRADRAFLHVRESAGRPDYVVLGDVFVQDGRRAHTYRSFLHSEPGNEIHVTNGGAGRVARARVDAPGGAGMDVSVVHADRAPALAVGTARAAYPGLDDRPVLTATHKAKALRSLTVLSPTAPGEVAPAVHPLDARGGVAARVGDGPEPDVVVLGAGRRVAVDALELATDAMLAFVRPAGGPASWSVVEGTSLTVDGRRYLQAKGGRVTVAASPHRISVEGEGLRELRLHAPGADLPEVLLNGRPIPVARCGPQVVWPTSGGCIPVLGL